jgi:tetratricopeptide (TPR) repeat protein
LADDVVRRQIDHRSRQNLEPEAAARAALVYLGKAENARKPTQALYGLRTRCREILGEKAMADADKQLAAKTPPTIAADHYLRGLAAFNARQRAEAIEAFEAALRLEPTHYWSMMNLGYCLAELGQGQEDLLGSAWVFTGCILKRPEHEYGYYARAITYFRLGRYEDAITDCTKAIAVEHEMAGAWVFRGVAYLKLGQKAKALFNCNMAIRINPKYPLAWFHRGLIYADLGHWDQARADYAMALKLDPTFAKAWNNLCEVYFRLEQWDKAVDYFSQRLASDSKFVPALVNRGLAYAKLGKSEEALADLGKVTELYPQWDAGWIQRANVYAQRQEWDKALKEYSKALAIWSKVIAQNPQDPERHNNQAWALATHAEPRFRNPRRAVELAMKAVELAPKAETYWNTLGAAQYRAGAWQDARAALEESMKLSKGGTSFDWFFLAMVHWRLGHKDEARKLYERAVQWMSANQPQNDELRRFRAEAAELLGIQERGTDAK